VRRKSKTQAKAVVHTGDTAGGISHYFGQNLD